MKWLPVAVALLMVCVCSNALAENKSPKLMFILMDGFRWNYFDKADFPGFRKFFQSGVKADYMTVDFPSFSLPNYYSVLTGLHVESHGMVGNNMYDERTGKYLDLGNESSWYIPEFWQGAEPIWIEAEKQGKRSYVYYWMGCEVEIKGRKPTFCEPYFYDAVNKLVPDVTQLSSAANTGLHLFKNNSADLVVIYFEASDAYGHLFGPDSQDLLNKILEVDTVMDQLIENITSQGLDEEVSVIVVSDHGMTEISPSRSINLTDTIDTSDLEAKIIDAGPVVNIWPKSDRTEKVYNDIKAKETEIGHFKVYRKNEIPDKWYYKDNYRIPPLMVVADPGWMILQPYKPSFTSYKGFHGYDNFNTDMRGIFFAKGPGLKQNSQLSSINIVDVYNLMCYALEIEPSPNNGTWSSFLAVLRDSSRGSRIESSFMFAFILYFVLVVFQ